MTSFETVQAEPGRDPWGRPLVIPPGGGKPTPYTRCTTFIDVLEDKFNLQKWMQRMVAVGIATRPDLHVAAASLATDPDGNKKQLDDVCEQAVKAAKGTAKATIGTALHSYIERINLRQDPGIIPDAYQPHINAYKAATGILHPIHVERFVVQDELEVGGTPDLIANIDGEQGAHVCDLKTGPATLRYGALKIAMQMAIYAHSQLYNPASGTREQLDVNLDRGLVIALDSDTAKCSLHWVDLVAGWEAVQVAKLVRQWRKRKGILADYTPPAAAQPTAGAPVLSNATDPVGAHIQAALYAAIAESPDRDSLQNLWERSMNVWTDSHTEAAKRRLEALTANQHTNTCEENQP